MFSGLGARVYFLSTFSTQLYRVLYLLWFNFEVPALYYSMYLTDALLIRIVHTKHVVISRNTTQSYRLNQGFPTVWVTRRLKRRQEKEEKWNFYHTKSVISCEILSPLQGSKNPSADTVWVEKQRVSKLKLPATQSWGVTSTTSSYNMNVLLTLPRSTLCPTVQ